jgi:ABC-type bacteriocin/lantibiotic exporter with double-glycine peptidase domain
MFSIVAVRIIPTISQISTHVNNIKYSSVARQHLLTELTGSRQNTHKERKFPTNSMQDQKVMSLCLEGISYSYRKDMAVLDNINFCVDRGSIVGIQGPSGSGKSTLAKIILGLISHKEGSINVNGRLIENIDELRSYVSYVPQHPYIFDGTVEYNICLNQPVNKDKIENILEITNLTFLADRMDEHLSNEESTLSVGQVQRLGIARALYSSRDIMIFDEPSSALDSDSENLIKQTLNQIKRDKVIVIISHSDNMLSICDYIHIMKTNLPQ